MNPAATAPLTELHRTVGAEFGAFLGCSLPSRFAAVEQEYGFARSGVAVVDTNFLASLEFTGPDRVRYLNAITTGDVQGLKEGRGVAGLLLNPQGHILAELQAYALADRLLVVTHASVRERTAQTLEKFIIMDDVTMADITDQTGSVGVQGPGTAVLLYEACGVKLEAMPPLGHREVVVGAIPCRVVRWSAFGQLGATLLVERAQLPALWQILLDDARRHGGGPAGYEALNALRLEAGVPWFGHDFDDKVIPHETGLEASHISYTKGCYTGQEIVERVRSRGQVNRRRVGLAFTGPQIPAAGAQLLAAGKEVGLVTSAAFSPALRSPIGMGYVRREHNSPGTKLDWEGGSAEVIELPIKKGS